MTTRSFAARAALWFAVALALVGGGTAQVPSAGIPDTPAGRVARAWFDALAAGTDEAAVAFERAHRSAAKLAQSPPEERAANWRSLRSQLGTLTVERVLQQAPSSIAVLATTDKVPIPLRVAFELEADGGKLTSLEVRPHMGAAEPRLGRYDEWRDLADLLEQVRDDTAIPAIAAAVWMDGKVADAAAVGVRRADGEDGVAVTDRFHLGSITKSFTATVIGALVDRGDLTWGLTLAEALPDVEMREGYRDVTLAQVLRHRAALPAYLTMDEAVEARIAAAGDAVAQRAALVARVLSEPLAGEPGKTFGYSNAGYAIAGHVAERAAGKPWEELVTTLVLRPIGMKTATVGWPWSAGDGEQPRGHFDFGRAIRAQEVGEYSVGAYLAPAGDLSCSASDLVRYAGVHLAGLRGKDGPLEVSTVRALHQPHDGPGRAYAAGWMIETVDGVVVHRHGGSGGTFMAQLELEPESGIAVAVMVNVGLVGQRTAETLAGLIRARHRAR